MTTGFPEFLDKDDVNDVAQQLLGCVIEKTIGGEAVHLRIVETESYDETDAASHSYKGRTARTEVMFGESGHLYVYFTYGMHYCCNIVTGRAGVGQAVLLRALEPLDHMSLLEKRRHKTGIEVTNGPAKICAALGIDREDNGHDLRQEPMRLVVGGLNPGETVTVATRIGISQNKDALRRFYIEGNPYVSKK